MTRLKRLAGGPVTCSGTTVAEPTPVVGIVCALTAGAAANNAISGATSSAVLANLTYNPLEDPPNGVKPNREGPSGHRSAVGNRLNEPVNPRRAATAGVASRTGTRRPAGSP